MDVLFSYFIEYFSSKSYVAEDLIVNFYTISFISELLFEARMIECAAVFPRSLNETTVHEVQALEIFTFASLISGNRQHNQKQKNDGFCELLITE